MKTKIASFLALLALIFSLVSCMAPPPQRSYGYGQPTIINGPTGGYYGNPRSATGLVPERFSATDGHKIPDNRNFPQDRQTGAVLLGVTREDHVLRRNKKTGQVIDVVVGKRELNAKEAREEMVGKGVEPFPSYMTPGRNGWELPDDVKSPIKSHPRID